MDFTELYKQTGNLNRFSPNGLYLATAVHYRLVIRDADSLQILHLFQAAETIGDLAWAQDSELIITVSFKTGLIQIWNLKNDKWTGKIEDEILGFSRVIWTPDSRHLMSFSPLNIRCVVWSLLTKEVNLIHAPKYSDKGYQFRSDGRYFAIAEKEKGKEYICIYDTIDWVLLKRWQTDTVDLENIAWSPDGRFIAVWESSMEYKIIIYYPDGRLVSSFSAYDHGLGIKSVTWSPSSQFLVVGSYDQKVRFLNYYTWKPLIEFTHPSNLSVTDVKIYKEVSNQDFKELALLSTWTHTNSSSEKIRYYVNQGPYHINSIKPDKDKPHPKIGISLLKFNADGRYMVTKNDNMPNFLWIWDVAHLKQIALIQQVTPIQRVLWNPIIPSSLIFSCGTGHIYCWNGEKLGCDAIEIPAVNFNIQDMRWNHDGKSIVVMDKEKFTVAFPVQE